MWSALVLYCGIVSASDTVPKFGRLSTLKHPFVFKRVNSDGHCEAVYYTVAVEKNIDLQGRFPRFVLIC